VIVVGIRRLMGILATLWFESPALSRCSNRLALHGGETKFAGTRQNGFVERKHGAAERQLLDK
jgi:hypothetical protein